MSTFGGLVEEIPGISVDRFDGKNLRSCVFFLSHFHSDHMVGLDHGFFERLARNKQYMYCTLLSKLFLEGKFYLSDYLSSYIKAVVPCSPTIVEYVVDDRPESLTVVSVNAGHCPGSVMFIFERKNARVLYTGDFRVNPRDLPRLKPLLEDPRGSSTLPRKFDKIYLDTTFLSPDFMDFPSRQESLSEIVRVAGDWIARHRDNVVILECSALIGPEYVFMELKQRLDKRVHVKSQISQNFSRIPELEACITNDGNSTPIHACMSKMQKSFLRCRDDVKPENILTIVPSALRWKGRDLSTNISERDSNDDNRFYVCLSMHSSFNELKAFVERFDGAKFFACVDNPIGSVQFLLDDLTKKTDKLEHSISKTYNLEPLTSRILERPRIKSQYFSDDSSD